jgi:hypothetical protein
MRSIPKIIFATARLAGSKAYRYRWILPLLWAFLSVLNTNLNYKTLVAVLLRESQLRCRRNDRP